MKTKVEGVVYHIGQEEQISDRFSKRLLVVEVEDENPQFNQKIPIEFQNNNCDHVDKVSIGDSVAVEVNIRGREWVAPDQQRKFFLTLVGWKVEVTRQDTFGDMTQSLIDNPAVTPNQETKRVEAAQQSLLNNKGEVPKSGIDKNFQEDHLRQQQSDAQDGLPF